MDRDTPDKLDQFSGANYQPLNYGQMKPTNQVSNQWTNQMMSAANNQWNNNQVASGYQQAPTNQPSLTNQPAARSRTRFSLDPADHKFLNECSREGVWGLSIPATLGFVVYRQYNSFKTLRPFSLGTMFWQGGLVYFATRLMWAPVCYQRLAKKNPDFLKRIQEAKNQFQIGDYNSNTESPPPYYAQQQHSTPPQQHFNQSKQFNQPPRNSPYLQPQYRADTQEQSKDFVDDSYDGKFDREYK